MKRSKTAKLDKKHDVAGKVSTQERVKQQTDDGSSSQVEEEIVEVVLSGPGSSRRVLWRIVIIVGWRCWQKTVSDIDVSAWWWYWQETETESRMSAA